MELFRISNHFQINFNYNENVGLLTFNKNHNFVYR